jgi:hypothetical protein
MAAFRIPSPDPGSRRLPVKTASTPTLALLTFAIVGCDNATEALFPHQTPSPAPYATETTLVDITPAGFHFLPPIAGDVEASFDFDAGLAPEVKVCTSPTCDTVHARYTTTQGTGSEVVRADTGDEHYIVNWNLKATGAVAGEVYFVRVLLGGHVLGSAAVHVVATSREASNFRPDGSVVVVADRTLPIRFRVAPPPTTEDLWLNGTGDPGELNFVTLHFPVQLEISAGESSGLIYGRVYHAGVTDVQFTASARIQAEIGYGPAASDPRVDSSWQWFPASFGTAVGNDHEYAGSFIAPGPGTYSYTYRFQLDGLGYTAADLDGAGSTGGGIPFDPSQLGTMTVIP